MKSVSRKELQWLEWSLGKGLVASYHGGSSGETLHVAASSSPQRKQTAVNTIINEITVSTRDEQLGEVL